jgi:MoaA/NifB/PqqE/SkfB family radical SAM enzyme
MGGILQDGIMNTESKTLSGSLRRLIIEPTYACNLRCEHCYVARTARAVNRAGYLNNIFPVTFWCDVLQDVPDKIIVHFTGGEIFTYPEIFDLLERTAGRNPFTFVTNGSLLDEIDCERLAELGPSHVTISINGNENIHDGITGVAGSFRSSINTIRILGLLLPAEKLSVNFVLLPGNYMTIYEVCRLLEDVGAERLVVQLFDPALFRCGIAAGTQNPPSFQCLDWSGEALFKLRNLLEDIVCKTDRNLSICLASDMTPLEILAFLSGEFNADNWTCSDVFDSLRCSPTGDVYTCNGLKMGELGKERVMDIWYSAAYEAFRQSHSRKVLGPECRGCCKVRRR